MSEYLQDTANQSPGTILRRGREASRLSKTEVAQQLHLTVDTIERIEADDYEKLPAVAFVRGYIRAYAKLLKLPADEIVVEFDRLGRTDQPVEFSTQKIYGERTTINDKMLWIGAGMTVVLMVIGVIWWQYQSGGADRAKPVAQNSTKEAVAKKEVAPHPNTTNNQPSSSPNIVTEILQVPQARTPVVINNQVNKTKSQSANTSATTDHQSVNSDDTQGQKLEDVQPDLTAPF
jgi:cytoskeleton protein RodZ